MFNPSKIINYQEITSGSKSLVSKIVIGLGEILIADKRIFDFGFTTDQEQAHKSINIWKQKLILVLEQLIEYYSFECFNIQKKNKFVSFKDSLEASADGLICFVDVITTVLRISLFENKPKFKIKIYKPLLNLLKAERELMFVNMVSD